MKDEQIYKFIETQSGQGAQPDFADLLARIKADGGQSRAETAKPRGKAAYKGIIAAAAAVVIVCAVSLMLLGISAASGGRSETPMYEMNESAYDERCAGDGTGYAETANEGASSDGVSNSDVSDSDVSGSDASGSDTASPDEAQ